MTYETALFLILIVVVVDAAVSTAHDAKITHKLKELNELLKRKKGRGCEKTRN